MMIPEPEKLVEAELLSEFEVDFARILAELGGETATEALLAAAFACRAVSMGHVCLDLASLTGLDRYRAEGFSLPRPDAWLAALGRSALVGDGTDPTPLVLERNRLYLTRYWRYEELVSEILLDRAGGLAEADENLLAGGLDRLFPADREGGAWSGQRRAAELAVRRLLTIVSGGPGTGKTSTVVRILALVQEQALAAGPGEPLRLLLLAPTGKAAARLSQSVQGEKARLKIDDRVRRLIPDQALTIHRALGISAAHPTRPRYSRAHPLEADVLLVDETSMVDMALMARLLEAVPPGCRLILMGDSDQLASVEAGSIFGDICQAAEEGASPLASCHVRLQKSFRFDSRQGIGALAQAIKAGDGDQAMAVLADRGQDQVVLRPWRAEGGDDAFNREIAAGFQGYLAAADPLTALRRFNSFRILCAHRRGPGGVERLNPFVEALLGGRGLLGGPATWYRGRPVMILANSYGPGLFNGDIGMVWPESGRGRELRVYFPDQQGTGVRRIPPARLPAHETAYAMTIHKSQGSEFDRVAIVLPGESSPVLTRELIYTAVTRARDQVIIFGTAAELRTAIGRRVERASGLRDKLGRGNGDPR